MDLKPQYGEAITADVVIPFGKDVPQQSFNISTFVVNKTTEDDVIQRHEKARLEMLTHGMMLHVMQSGKRTVAGMNGHEVVVWANEGDYTGMISFRGEFSFGGEANNYLKPNTNIIFDGTNFPKSIKPEVLLSLWNNVLDNMHVSG